ncbi:MAG: hypothetical protein ACLUPK_06990 [Veillonella sp.]
MSHSYCDTHVIVYVLHQMWQMRLCLFADDEADLVSLVRNGATEEDLALHIERALQRKQERHDGVGRNNQNVLWCIGG